MNEIIVIISLLFFIALGYALFLVSGLLSELNFFEKLPYSFGLGMGLVAFQLFLYSQLKIQWNYETLLFPWIFLIFYVLYKKAPKIYIKHFNYKVKLSFTQKCLSILLLIAVAYTAFEAWLRPLSAWDGWAIWLLKAKMFYIDGFVNPHAYHLLRDSYPYVINLSVTFLYIMLGKVDDRAVLLLFFGFYLMLGICFFNFSKKIFGITMSLFFTFLLLSLQNVIRHGGRFEAGYADLALGYYIFMSSTLLFQYIKSNKPKALILCSIFLGLTSLVKDEGVVFSIIMQLMMFVVIIKNKKFKQIFLSMIWLIPFLDWNLFKYINDIHYSLYQNSTIHLLRFPQILLQIAQELLNIQNWNILWPIFFIGLFPFLFIKKRGMNIYLFFIMFLQILAYIFVFMISPYPPYIHVPNVMNRLLLHVVALCVLLVEYVFANTHVLYLLKGNGKKNAK